MNAIEEHKEEENKALIFFIIGFCFSPMWVVAFLMSRKSDNKRSRTLGNIGCGLCIAQIVVSICALVITMAIVIPVAIAGSNTNPIQPQ